LTNVEDFRPQGRPASESKPGHEPNTLVVRGLVWFAVALVAIGIAVEVILAAVMGSFSREEKRLEATEAPRFDDESVAFPAPRLQADLAVDLARMKQEEQDRIHGYGWIDRRAGIAHIPIEQAIKILAKSGLPATPSPEAKTTAGMAPASTPSPVPKPSTAPKADARPDSRREQER
jgi:hypothetical protein